MDMTRIKNDVNGNGRLVVHFLDCCTREELSGASDIGGNYANGISGNYANALKRMRAIGGRKFHNKQFGGGIVFQESCRATLQADIEKLTGRGPERLAAEKRAADRERLADEAPAILAALVKLTERAAALDQSATHDGLQNCDALAAARAVIERNLTREGVQS